MKELINRLRGQIYIQVECPFPERVLNLCSARKLAFWDLEWLSPTTFTCRLSRQDYRQLRQATEKMECVLTVVRREGAPYFLFRFRHRQALVTGLVGCAMALVLGSFFIWDFQVEGNDTVPTERILRALENNGVSIGTFGLSLDSESIRNHVLLEIPELSWITVNVSGCRAQVQVRERVFAPELVDSRQGANLVARRAGLVLKVQARGGVACVVKGSSVTEGQMLISGVEDTQTFGERVMAGMGSVQARTWYTLTAHVPLTVEQKQYTGKEKTCFSVIFGTHRIKFFSNSSIEEAKYDKITQRHPWTLFGLPLPITVEREVYRFYETVPQSRTPAQAEQSAGQALEQYLEDLVSPYGEVKSTLISSSQRGDILTVTLRAECQEEIGRSVPIYTQDTPPDQEGGHTQE